MVGLVLMFQLLPCKGRPMTYWLQLVAILAYTVKIVITIPHFCYTV